MQAVPSVLCLFVLFLFTSPTSDAAIACSNVVKTLTPCVGYLQSRKGSPSAGCCIGAKNVASTAKTTADRQAACNCIKNALLKMKPNDAALKALPTNCGLSLSFTLSTNVDCSKIK